MTEFYDEGGLTGPPPLADYYSPLVPEYHKGGFIYSLNKNRYTIKDITYTKSPIQDSIEFLIKYYDAEAGNISGVTVTVNNNALYGASTEQIMDAVANIAAGYVHDFKFYDALMNYFKGAKLFGTEQEHVYSASAPPAQEFLKASMNKPLHKSIAAGPNMQDVNNLPGVTKEVKHPTTGDFCLIKDIIINLNDVQMWTREEIADWLETLDVDLRFKSEADKVAEERKNNLANWKRKLELLQTQHKSIHANIQHAKIEIDRLTKEMENEQD